MKSIEADLTEQISRKCARSRRSKSSHFLGRLPTFWSTPLAFIARRASLEVSDDAWSAKKPRRMKFEKLHRAKECAAEASFRYRNEFANQAEDACIGGIWVAFWWHWWLREGNGAFARRSRRNAIDCADARAGNPTTTR